MAFLVAFTYPGAFHDSSNIRTSARIYRKNSCHWTVKFSTTKYNQILFTTVSFQLNSDSISTYIKQKYSSSKLFYLLRQIGRAKGVHEPGQRTERYLS